jgi:S-adenosylmethionine-diacylgycerolhomoserine-N-methlytransferase
MQLGMRMLGDSPMAVPQDFDPDAASSPDATLRMNRMYRWQRFIYDATRRYYLLGRDSLIAGLKPAAGASILEIGCGTGRNLVQTARRYPGTRLFGIDVSTEMLTSATSAARRCGLADRIRLAHGDAIALDARALFGVTSFDRIFISYSLSMIPDWPRVLERAVVHLAEGASLHVVDFGGQEQLPQSSRALLFRWLSLFDVTPRRELEATLLRLAHRAGAQLRFERPLRGYAQYAVLTLLPRS